MSTFVVDKFTVTAVDFDDWLDLKTNRQFSSAWLVSSHFVLSCLVWWPFPCPVLLLTWRSTLYSGPLVVPIVVCSSHHTQQDKGQFCHETDGEKEDENTSIEFQWKTITLVRVLGPWCGDAFSYPDHSVCVTMTCYYLVHQDSIKQASSAKLDTFFTVNYPARKIYFCLKNSDMSRKSRSKSWGSVIIITQQTKTGTKTHSTITIVSSQFHFVSCHLANKRPWATASTR